MNRRNSNLVQGLAAAVLFVIGATAARAVEPVSRNWRGLAVKGYDVVAYFDQSKAVEGSSDIALDWNGATWRFSTAANREAFRKEPAKYAPQFGGYCAWAVSQGYTADIDPEAWKIVDGRLYLNYSRKVQAMWEKDTAGNIARGNENWPGLAAKK